MFYKIRIVADVLECDAYRFVLYTCKDKGIILYPYNPFVRKDVLIVRHFVGKGK